MCALIRTGSIISDITGKIGGHVFQRTKGGLAVRTQGGVINPGLNTQNANRIIATRIQQAWRGLSASDRNLWEVYATFKNKSSRKNILAKLTGQSIFMQENTVRLIHINSFGSFSPAILTTPTIIELPEVVKITSITNAASILTLSTDYNIPDASKFFVVYLSKPLLPSQISNYNKKKIFCYVAANGTSQGYTSIYLLKFGILPEVGQVLNTEIALYDKDINTFGAFQTQRITIT